MNTEKTREEKIFLAHNFPDCSYLVKEKGCCLWLSNRLGLKVTVSPIDCNFVCTKSGPYCGQPIQDLRAADRFLFDHWYIKYSFRDPLFTKRVRNHYATVARIAVPPEWPIIRDALGFLRDNVNFRRVMLTGSVITDAPRPLKDFDITIVFDSMRNLIEQEEVIRQRLPKLIDGVKVDYFLAAEENGQLVDTFFVELDPEAMVLYTSRWFNLRLEAIAPGITLKVAPVAADFEEFMKEAVERHALNVDRPPPNLTLKSARPGDVLAWVIHQLTGSVPCSHCLRHADKMNEWGWLKCWLHRDEVLNWLTEEANKRGVAVEKSQLMDLLRAAWKMSGQMIEQ